MFETLIHFYQSIWCHILFDNLQSHHHGNLISNAE